MLCQRMVTQQPIVPHKSWGGQIRPFAVAASTEKAPPQVPQNSAFRQEGRFPSPASYPRQTFWLHCVCFCDFGRLLWMFLSLENSKVWLEQKACQVLSSTTMSSAPPPAFLSKVRFSKWLCVQRKCTFSHCVFPSAECRVFLICSLVFWFTSR